MVIACNQVYALGKLQISAEHMESADWQADGLVANINLQDMQHASIQLHAQIRHPQLPSPTTLELGCNVTGNTAITPAGGIWQTECNRGLFQSKLVNLPFKLSVAQQQALSDANIRLRTTTTINQPHYVANLQVTKGKLSDASGMHAAENLTLGAALDVRAVDAGWQWRLQVNNPNGEIFWQPFYVSSHGILLQASGAWNAQQLQIDSADLTWQSIGDAHLQGQWDGQLNTWQMLALSTQHIDLKNAYAVAKPVLEGSLLSDLDVEGKANFIAHWQAGAIQDFHLTLHDVNLEDKQKRFAWYGLHADVPWGTDSPTSASLRFTSGRLLRIPFGETHLSANVNHYAVTADHWRFPILDGALVLDDVSAATVAGQWFGHLQATVMPIDMAQLSHELGWPRMEGKVAASIPKVTYADDVLTTSGELGFNVFDGHIIVQHLSMQSPLGQQATLDADLTMRGLDLGALTRTFSFGAIEGRMDGEVSELQLVNWQPVHFNAQFQTSAGRFDKKISQRAVENISALGGAGAAAAIQRSFLRFFKEFNYEKIGLSCRLRGNLCEMNGLASTAGGYTIVKGSGIPSMTVMGYNHSVSWNELLERIQSAIAGNASPVIR